MKTPSHSEPRQKTEKSPRNKQILCFILLIIADTIGHPLSYGQTIPADSETRRGNVIGGLYRIRYQEIHKNEPRWMGFGPSLCVNPYRKVGDKYCSLVPLFTWVSLNKPTPNPMPAWRIIDADIAQILPDGLLLKHGSTRRLLRHHPEQASLVDGRHIDCLAFPISEPFKYKDVMGSINTVEQYDYGTLFDPAQRARDLAAAQKTKPAK